MLNGLDELADIRRIDILSQLMVALLPDLGVGAELAGLDAEFIVPVVDENA